MSLPNIFTTEVSAEIVNRINKLTANTPAQWGKMSVNQMLAHCNVTYEMIYENIHPKPNFLMGFILKTFVKSKVVGEGTYPKSSPTAPQFVIKNQPDFDLQKTRLIDYINRTQQLGGNAFDGKESHSFGILNTSEWNNMMYKHLHHHLTQFGV